MTVTPDERVAAFDGDGVTSEYPVTFQFFEIEVVVNGVVQTQGADYEISQTAPGRTGSVIFTSGSIPPVGTENVQIRGATTIEQAVDYTENNQFPAETIEQALDRLTMICGEFNRRVLQSLRNVPLGDDIPALDFAANPNKVIRVGADGVPELVTPAFLTEAIYDEIIDARNATLVAQAAAEAAQAAAETAETNAETAETNAETAETNAETSAANAATSETNAGNSATAAASSASAAASSATDAANSATDADDSAIAAAASALAAAASESAAATSETNAATSETNAANSASAAATSASDAATSASDAAAAKTGAETAETNAESAQTAAEAAQAAAEAAVASINMPTIVSGDAGKSVVVKEDESGYELKRASGNVRRNRIVNPALQISQENGDASGTSDGYYVADQFCVERVTSAGTITAQRVQSTTPGGARDRARITITTADTSLAAGEYLQFRTRLEGVNVSDLLWGTAAARQILVRFLFKGPAGTYALRIGNSAGNRSYVALFSPSAANTDEIIEIAVPGDTSGTWLADTGIGMQLSVVLACGSTYQGSVGWQSGNILGTSSVSNGMGTGSAVFELGEFGLYLDSDSSGVAPEWELPEWANEYHRCLRYYATISGTLRSSWNDSQAPSSSDNRTRVMNYTFPLPMRVAPSVTIGSGFSASQVDRLGFQATRAGVSGSSYTTDGYTANARL